jgi:hypothetical protein
MENYNAILQLVERCARTTIPTHFTDTTGAVKVTWKNLLTFGYQTTSLEISVKEDF